MKQLHLNRENGMVFDPRTGKRFRVNETGAGLLKGWQLGKSSESLLEELMEQHEISLNDAERYFQQFVRQCTLAGLPVPESGKSKSPTAVLRNTTAA